MAIIAILALALVLIGILGPLALLIERAERPKGILWIPNRELKRARTPVVYKPADCRLSLFAYYRSSEE